MPLPHNEKLNPHPFEPNITFTVLQVCRIKLQRTEPGAGFREPDAYLKWCCHTDIWWWADKLHDYRVYRRLCQICVRHSSSAWTWREVDIKTSVAKWIKTGPTPPIGSPAGRYHRLRPTSYPLEPDWSSIRSALLSLWSSGKNVNFAVVDVFASSCFAAGLEKLYYYISVISLPEEAGSYHVPSRIGLLHPLVYMACIVPQDLPRQSGLNVSDIEEDIKRR